MSKQIDPCPKKYIRHVGQLQIYKTVYNTTSYNNDITKY